MTDTQNIPRPTIATTHHADDDERLLFIDALRNYIPPHPFDVHAHLYASGSGIPLPDGVPLATWQHWYDLAHEWMGDRTPEEGLFFGFPKPDQDTAADNELVAGEVGKQPGSRGLMLVRPKDDPAAVEQAVVDQGWAGFKVYHVYADRDQSFNAPIDEYTPRWMWELMNKHGLVLMLHIVRKRGLADENNQQTLMKRCREYPNARVILAHAGRGFCADHTIDGIDALAGLDNVFFDTSAICESAAFIAILQRFGSSRLMYGSDFPVSQLRGRAISMGDGFYWLHDHNATYDGWLHSRPVLVGLESLLALRQAARLCQLKDTDMQRIFSENALQLLGLR